MKQQYRVIPTKTMKYSIPNEPALPQVQCIKGMEIIIDNEEILNSIFEIDPDAEIEEVEAKNLTVDDDGDDGKKEDPNKIENKENPSSSETDKADDKNASTSKAKKGKLLDK